MPFIIINKYEINPTMETTNHFEFCSPYDAKYFSIYQRNLDNSLLWMKDFTSLYGALERIETLLKNNKES